MEFVGAVAAQKMYQAVATATVMVDDAISAFSVAKNAIAPIVAQKLRQLRELAAAAQATAAQAAPDIYALLPPVVQTETFWEDMEVVEPEPKPAPSLEPEAKSEEPEEPEAKSEEPEEPNLLQEPLNTYLEQFVTPTHKAKLTPFYCGEDGRIHYNPRADPDAKYLREHLSKRSLSDAFANCPPIQRSVRQRRTPDHLDGFVRRSDLLDSEDEE